MTASPEPSTPPVQARAELFGPGRLPTTLGILLLISLIGFEAMGVGTAMPAIVAEFGAVSAYAWPFVTFMAASVFATVLGGRWCDRNGPRAPLVAGPVVFGAGLIVAGIATGMPHLLVGRVLQGLGAGVIGVAIYVLIAHVYPEGARPAVFGLISSAWVLPSLLGPPVSGIVTDTLSWHWVFLGLVPIMALAVGLVVPAVRRLERPEPSAAAQRPWLVPAAFGAATGVAALSWAGQQTGAAAVGIGLAAVVVLAPALRILLPRGVFRARRGIATVVLARGLAAGVFFGVNSYLPLMLHDTHGWSLAAAGAPLIVGSLGWSAASAWQGRKPGLSRSRLLQVGFALLAAGTAGMLLVAPSWGVPWLALPFWVVAGVGMGLAFSSISFLQLRHSATDEIGFNSSAAQISDQLTTAVLIGAGGALLSLLVLPAAALPVLLAVLVVLGVLGAAVAPRTAG